MKRSLISLAFLLVCFGGLYAYKKQQERQYFVQVPERLVDSFLKLVNGNVDVVSVKDADEIRSIVLSQLSYQGRQFYVQDSTRIAQDSIRNKMAADSLKKDSVKKKK